ncbi:hypothetical protein LBMAG57_22160 [Verrucomicrobiota bacterium]|jgi:hypothetical protein|nr:hypothetical protein LBMAG57_22160 [Verrucomicrobiota bacterium]
MSDPIRESEFLPVEITRDAVLADPSANPFKLVVDPVMRIKLRRALFDLIENHDAELANYVSDGLLALDSYKEYIEIFAKSLRESMGTNEGIAYLLRACGFHTNPADINLNPETRWKIQR